MGILYIAYYGSSMSFLTRLRPCSLPMVINKPDYRRTDVCGRVQAQLCITPLVWRSFPDAGRLPCASFICDFQLFAQALRRTARTNGVLAVLLTYCMTTRS